MRRILFWYYSGEKPGLLYQIQIDESFDEPELVSDYGSLDDAMTYAYDLIVVDEGHHIFKKKSGIFLCLLKDEERTKKIESILKENENAQAMILCDSSQASSTKLEWSEEFNNEEKHLTLTEVIRSVPLLTEASSLFQRFNQDKTTNLNNELKGQGLRPGARIFKSEGGVEEDYQTYGSKVLVSELEKIMTFYPDEDLHDSIAIIVSNDDARQCLLKALEASLKSKLGKKKASSRTVTAKEASERFSNDPPSDGKGYIIVDTMSNMNGMERLFVILVDMDKALDRNEEKNHKNLSKVICYLP